MMTDLAAFAELVPRDYGLCVISTLRRDGSVQSSVVNAGVLEHPLRGGRVVGLVATGGSRKLHNLRLDPRATIVARAGWRWATVEGNAEIIWAAPHFPDCCFRVLLCRKLLTRVLITDFARRPVAKP